MNHEPTKALIEGLSSNDRKSQELLYRQFYSYGMSVCLRYTANRDEAVEVLNDSFMKVFSKINQFNPDLSFKTWFRRILINTAINHFKHELKHAQTESLDQAEYLNGKDHGVISQMSYEEMIEAIRGLSPIYRTVFNLYAIEGYTHEEIAAQLGVTVGASKSNLSRARANLREILRRNHEKGLAKYER
ncbi:RNA polymerase sigma factor [Echinicola sp. CAU 1574]|uniref:RNA polymerase sigma factor n=1 Tax=Echinicola arenosa TaxID=2774144 RepID=A0ABR9AEH6_9BACT|nr:RNA polymerase sigma factor [Echinicola arenosa]MBD8487137.1 RNA polymerase sigma factor [Echinicola arenosa]